jgi:hypothetical protein
MQDADYSRIPLYYRNGPIRAYALIDRSDEEQARYRWSFHDGYAIRYTHANGFQQGVLLHREILGLAYGEKRQADHINGDRLDCRRSNLRVVTHAQNMQNRVAYKGSTSRHRGVSFDRGKWRATVVLDRKQYYLGRFDDEEEAAAAASAFRREHMPFTTERLA